MSSEPRLHLAVALKDTGWHPAAWRLPGAATHELFTAGYWTRLMTEAEAGTLDFVTVEDGLSLQSAAGDRADDRIDQVRGSLSAVQVAACSAPLTRRVGLVRAVPVGTCRSPIGRMRRGTSTGGCARRRLRMSRPRGGRRPATTSTRYVGSGTAGTTTR